VLAAVGDGAKDGVLSVQPTWTLTIVAVLRDEEELAATRVWLTGLRHRNRAGVVQPTVAHFIRQGVLRLVAST